MIPFDQTSFPLRIRIGASGGPSFPTTILKRRDGRECRIASRRNPSYRFNVNPLISNESLLKLVANFYAARTGSARAFRYRDWTDFSTAPDDVSDPQGTDQPLTPTDGVYFLKKIYTSGAQSYVRRIFKPRIDSFILMSNGTGVIDAGDYEINSNSGIVTFPGGVPDGTLSWGAYFDHAVRFSPDMDDLTSISWDAFSQGSVQVELEGVDYYDETPEFGTDSIWWPITTIAGLPQGTGTPSTGGPGSTPGGSSEQVGGTPDLPPVPTSPCGECEYPNDSTMTVGYSMQNGYGYPDWEIVTLPSISGLVRISDCVWQKVAPTGGTLGNWNHTNTANSFNNSNPYRKIKVTKVTDAFVVEIYDNQDSGSYSTGTTIPATSCFTGSGTIDSYYFAGTGSVSITE